jgi:hypothetical protein
MFLPLLKGEIEEMVGAVFTHGDLLCEGLPEPACAKSGILFAADDICACLHAGRSYKGR